MPLSYDEMEAKVAELEGKLKTAKEMGEIQLKFTHSRADERDSALDRVAELEGDLKSEKEFGRLAFEGARQLKAAQTPRPMDEADKRHFIRAWIGRWADVEWIEARSCWVESHDTDAKPVQPTHFRDEPPPTPDAGEKG